KKRESWPEELRGAGSKTPLTNAAQGRSKSASGARFIQRAPPSTGAARRAFAGTERSREDEADRCRDQHEIHSRKHLAGEHRQLGAKHMPFQILIGDKSANSSPDVAMTSSAASAVAHSTTSNPLRLENVRKNLALQGSSSTREHHE